MNEPVGSPWTSVHGAVGLGPIVASAAIPVFNELIQLCHNSHLTLDEAVSGLRPGATEAVRAMARERRVFVDELSRELRRLGSQPQVPGDTTESLRRARTRLKTRWHRGDDEAVAGDLFEFEMQSLRRLEHVLERAVLPVRCRPLMARLRATLARDCHALECLAADASPPPGPP